MMQPPIHVVSPSASPAPSLYAPMPGQQPQGQPTVIIQQPAQQAAPPILQYPPSEVTHFGIPPSMPAVPVPISDYSPPRSPVFPVTGGPMPIQQIPTFPPATTPQPYPMTVPTIAPQPYPMTIPAVAQPYPMTAPMIIQEGSRRSTPSPSRRRHSSSSSSPTPATHNH
jgi:hypothetical protein